MHCFGKGGGGEGHGGEGCGRQGGGVGHIHAGIILSASYLLGFDLCSVSFLAELFRGMLFKWKGENKKSHQK